MNSISIESLDIGNGTIGFSLENILTALFLHSKNPYCNSLFSKGANSNHIAVCKHLMKDFSMFVLKLGTQ